VETAAQTNTQPAPDAVAQGETPVKHKYITRLNTKKGSGWWVRIRVGRDAYQKYFGDFSHKGTENALRCAIEARDLYCADHGIPTEYDAVSDLCNRNSKTGIKNISLSEKGKWVGVNYYEGGKRKLRKFHFKSREDMHIQLRNAAEFQARMGWLTDPVGA
jgi:hypothetical protein